VGLEPLHYHAPMSNDDAPLARPAAPPLADLPVEATAPARAAKAIPPAEPEAQVKGATTAAEAGEEMPTEVIEPEPATEAGADAEEAIPDSALSLADRVGALITAFGGTEGKGNPALPDRQDALALLLAEPPPGNDFAALDALYACWPKATQNSESRALLAVAYNLTRNFGLPDKLPMASSKAWRMLSPTLFEAELAQRLADTGTFIADWQKTQRHFLILEFGEIELVEYLFEALPPSNHADLLAGVMNFKVLSNRRMGLLRRIPNRVKKQIIPMLPTRKEEALLALAHTKALLERLAEPSGFAPIVDTADKMAEEIEKMMKAVAAIGQPPPAPPTGGGGQALGRIG